MLTSFSLERYKPFVDRTNIEVRPLTLFFGHNNVGKSALLRILPLLADSLLDKGRSPLKRGPASREGTFFDLLSRAGPATQSLCVGLTWGNDCEFEVEIRDLPERHRQLIPVLRFAREGRTVSAHWIPREDESGRPGQWYELVEQDSRIEARIEWTGLVPNLCADDADGWARIFALQREDLLRIAGGVQWLGSLRAAPDRTFQPGDAPPSKLEPDGSGVQEILYFDEVDRGGLLEEVASWFERHFSQTLELSRLGTRAQLSLSPSAARGLRVPLADTGEGMAQVLPVLVAMAMARNAAAHESKILALEQPELHLHPSAELALAQLFAETASAKSPPILVVETHSENLLLSIQLQIAQGRLPPSAVAAYWIERLGDGSAVVRRIELDREGQAHGWPRGVFAEDLELARQLYQARRGLRAS